MSSPASASLIASVATGWVLDEAHELVRPVCLSWIEAWRTKEDLSPLNLWLPLAKALRRYGCFDAEVGLCRLALSLDPAQVPVTLRLADSLIGTGGDDEARSLLSDITAPAAARIEALSLLARLPDPSPSHLDELETLLLDSPDWSGRHGDLARLFLARGMVGRAAGFLAAWTRLRGVTPASVTHIAGLTLLTGDPATARTLFTAIWPQPGNDMTRVFGQFSGHIPPYDDAVEAEWLRRIDTAFALDESQLAVLPLADFGTPDPGTTVLLVSFEHGAIPNDMAEHLAGTAMTAGHSLELYLDSALVLPHDCRMPDAVIGQRVEAFAAHLAKAKPSVVILDCCGPLGLRGLNPAVMADLKQQHGFRLVCLMRDAHSYALPGLRAWLPVCDSMVVFDPGTPLLDARFAPANAKVVILPVPSLHTVFLDRGDRGTNLAFVGSANFPVRQAILSVLLTEDIPVTTVLGKHLSPEKLDTGGYAHTLSQAGAVVNISAHTPTEHLITGRVWETIAAGALLIEQDNDAVQRFFTPCRHYLPWRNVEDIVQIARLMQRRPDVIRRVADEGHAWATRHYGAKAVWNTLVGHALRPNDGRDLDEELRAARAWHEVSIG